LISGFSSSRIEFNREWEICSYIRKSTKDGRGYGHSSEKRRPEAGMVRKLGHGGLT
jgi:hypothetical protein